MGADIATHRTPSQRKSMETSRPMVTALQATPTADLGETKKTTIVAAIVTRALLPAVNPSRRPTSWVASRGPETAQVTRKAGGQTSHAKTTTTEFTSLGRSKPTSEAATAVPLTHVVPGTETRRLKMPKASNPKINGYFSPDRPANAAPPSNAKTAIFVRVLFDIRVSPIGFRGQVC